MQDALSLALVVLGRADGVPAGELVVRRVGVDERRRLDVAAIAGVAAAGANGQPGGGSTRSGGRPGIVRRRVCGAASIAGMLSHQRLGVGHLDVGEQRLRRRPLDDAAGVHHDDVVGVPGDDAEVVGDEDDAPCCGRGAARR